MRKSGCLPTVVARTVYERAKERGLLEGPNKSARIALGVVGLVIFCWMPVSGAWQVFEEYSRFATRYRTGQFSLVEGIVEDFVPEPSGGHGRETFRLGEHHYAYSTSELVPGYHQLRARGGVIAPGVKVRIADIDGHIARIEIVD